MNFMDIVRSEKAKQAAVAPVNETETSTVAVLTDRDIPSGMPRTNRLDKMTTVQARWAIQNGDAWLAYLKSNGGEVYQSTGASETELSDAEKYQCICKVLDRVWLALAGNRVSLPASSLNEWCDTLRWALGVFPKGYEGPRGVIEAELDRYQ